MRVLGGALLASLALVLAQSGPLVKAQQATNAEKLIGIWEVTKSDDAPPGATVEFTKDGKIKIVVDIKGKTLNVAGTYKVEGNKIRTTLKFGPKEATEVLIIKTLSSTMLVTQDEKGKTDEYKKKK
jgi:uncharacterized protein (TIGR03066 family)